MATVRTGQILDSRAVTGESLDLTDVCRYNGEVFRSVLCESLNLLLVFVRVLSSDYQERLDSE